MHLTDENAYACIILKELLDLFLNKKRTLSWIAGVDGPMSTEFYDLFFLVIYNFGPNF